MRSESELSRYEEEEEFDAVTDVLAPKEVYLVAAPAGGDCSLMTSVIGQLEGIGFEAGFTCEQVTGYIAVSPVYFRAPCLARAASCGDAERCVD